MLPAARPRKLSRSAFVARPRSTNRAHTLRSRALLACSGAASSDRVERELSESFRWVERTNARIYLLFIHDLRGEIARAADDETWRKKELCEAQRLFAEMAATGHAERLARELSPAS